MFPSLRHWRIQVDDQRRPSSERILETISTAKPSARPISSKVAASPELRHPKRTSSPTTTARAPSSPSSQVRTKSWGLWAAKSRV
jgi:hypothetical protein